MPLPRWLGVGPRGCEWRVRAGIFGWLYSDSLSRCDNHRRHEGCRVGTELDMQRGVAEVGDGNVHRARAARLCMYVEALGRPLPRSGRAGRQRACVSTHSREAVLSKKTVKYPSNALHTRCITSWCIEGVWGAGVGSDGMQGAARPKRGCAKQAHDLARHVPATADPVPAPYPPSQLTNGHDSPSQPPPPIAPSPDERRTDGCDRTWTARAWDPPGNTPSAHSRRACATHAVGRRSAHPTRLLPRHRNKRVNRTHSPLRTQRTPMTSPTAPTPASRTSCPCRPTSKPHQRAP